ncbi:hypothetical protein [Paenibacillus residui]|uniref:Peptidase C-terminal archaeal/bacterial domain-containing protein n=1 Tax=Paenibacillus residui TaxID=629724 RepID=A0ABW3D6F1_9BACL
MSLKGKKWFSVISLSLVLVLLGSVAAFASNNTDGNGVTDEAVLQKPKSVKIEQPDQNEVLKQESYQRAETAGVLEVIEDTSPDFDILASFSISSSSLEPNHYVASSSTYYIDPGKDKLKYSVNWSPTGQDIQIGFVSKNDPNIQYYISNLSGGSASGTIGTSTLDAGEYYVVIGTPDTNTANVSVNGTFDWQ